MTKDKKLVFAIIFFLAALAILSALSGIISAAESTSCCEKTTAGAWCQNEPSANCDTNYKSAPTSCESTSYCKRGCCFDSYEGLCMENTPQVKCDEAGGTWADDAQCNIAQCQLGCCVLGDEAALVTSVRCKTLSGFYGLKTNFQSSITDELTCIATAKSEDEGACVTGDFEPYDCSFTKRSECTAAASANDTNSTVGFHEGILCSAEELKTSCGKSSKTTLVDGKDEVYFLDTCGNKANIYDAGRYNDNLYWTYVVSKDESCGAGSSNANSASCGNCDYYLGSVGKKSTRANSPTYGDNICYGLDCKDSSGEHKHGESWCGYDIYRDNSKNERTDAVGSRDFKYVCLDNEVLIEPCEDFRNQICVESTTGSYVEARCTTNKWQDCTQQSEQEDCEDENIRDCFWKEGYYVDSSTGKISKSTNITDESGVYLTGQGVCLPRHPPGFNFWGSSSTSSTSSSTTSTSSAASSANGSYSAPASGSYSSPSAGSYGTGYVTPTSSTSNSEMCGLASQEVSVKWTREKRPLDAAGLFGSSDWECQGDQYGDKSACTLFISSDALNSWASEMNSVCVSLGDCGGWYNWIDESTDSGFAAYNSSGRRVAGSGGSALATKNVTASQVAGAKASPAPPVSGGNFVSDFLKKMYGGR